MKTLEWHPRKRWFPDLKAEALAWWVRRASDQTLQSVICSRLRGVLLWQVFRAIRQRAQPDTHLNTVVEFRITGRRDGGIDRYQHESMALGQRRPPHGVDDARRRNHRDEGLRHPQRRAGVRQLGLESQRPDERRERTRGGRKSTGRFQPTGALGVSLFADPF
jgi:hypothetical protein